MPQAWLVYDNGFRLAMIVVQVVLALVLQLATCVCQSFAVGKPNVVFLITDDQRADTISVLGNPIVKTPHLDALANDGFVFRNAYCMGSTIAAVCNPSRHMLLSGMSLYRYNPKNRDGTLADVMNRAGYETWHIGKRGNTSQEYHKAFHHSQYLDDRKERTSGHHGRTAADQAIQFLKNGWDRTKPLFMFVEFEGPHDPRVADKQWKSLYRQDQNPLPPNFMPFHPFNNGELLVRDEQLAPWPRTPDVVREHLLDYYSCISCLDHQIGRIVSTLKDLNQSDNTIFVFTSDHGLAIGSHGLLGKQNLYEHSMKAPLIFAGHGIDAGSSDALVYLFDILPTVTDLVGASLADGLDGKSLRPVIEKQVDEVRDAIFLAYRDVQRAVRQRDWKLIRYPQVDVTQLFKLRDDPQEQRDLAGDPRYSQKMNELLAILRAEQHRYRDTVPLSVKNPQPAPVDETYFHAN